MSVYRVKVEAGQEPSSWKPEKFAEIDGNEMFVRHVSELISVAEATTIYGEQREDLKGAIMSVLADGLMPAFAELEMIRASSGKPLPLMDRRELYHDFCRKLWKAYKDLTQRAANVAGFEIGFLFGTDSKFETGLVEFQAKYPNVRSKFGDFTRKVRGRWQSELGVFRNTFLEHQNSDPAPFARFYEHDYIERLFEDSWNTIVDLLAMLLESRLAGGTKLGLPDRKQYPKWPNRFMFYHPGFGKP
jgi:hypothetical protein